MSKQACKQEKFVCVTYGRWRQVDVGAAALLRPDARVAARGQPRGAPRGAARGRGARWRDTDLGRHQSIVREAAVRKSV